MTTRGAGEATGRASTLRLAAPFLPVAGALFCIQLDFFSLGLALPTIAADLGTPTTDLQWLLSGYMIALGSLLIPAARLGDMLGRRAVLLTGVALFGLTSLVCGLAGSVPLLIAARVAQGAGAALIMPTAFALVSNATDEDVRPRVTGALLGIAGVGTALGPVVGGLLASTAGWRWVFLLNVPITVLAFVGGLRLPESRNADVPRSLAALDRWGVLAVIGGLTGISLAIDDVSAEGATSAVTVVPFVAGVALLAAFCLVETRFPAGIVMGAAVLASAPALVLVAVAGPLPLYVVALGLAGITTGMGYALGQVAVQNVLPPERSAEGTSVMLTLLICVGGLGVVAATAVIEAVGGGRATTGGIALALMLVAAMLLVAGVVTLVAEFRRLRQAASTAAGLVEAGTADTDLERGSGRESTGR